VKPLRWLLRGLFLAYSAPFLARFAHSLRHPAHAQATVLKRLTRLARQSSYGRHYGIETPPDFLRRLPIVSFDDLTPWVERVTRGEPDVLLPGIVRQFEPTSGSAGQSKLIPYPPTLLQSFRRMFVLWVGDLLRHDPGLGQGRFYFSISPRFHLASHSIAAGSQVGFESDADYLGRWLKPWLDPFFVQVPDAAAARDAESFKQAVSVALLKARDLESISIWNPTYLLILFDWISANRQDLLTANGPALHPDTRQALAETTIDWRRIWPSLRLVSCWRDGHAQAVAERLQDCLPDVRFQGKGLLATEAPLTIPLTGVTGGVPLLDDVYFEFETDDGHWLGLHELKMGESYQVIVSQMGGLYRYRLGDVVQVVGRIAQTPTLAFLGRGRLVSDLVGEKLSETLIRAEVSKLLPDDASVASFVPCRIGGDRYCLVMDHCSQDTVALAAHIDAQLLNSHHYRLARELGQLGPIEPLIHPQAASILAAWQTRQGMKWGDIKPTLLFVRLADHTLLDDLRTDDGAK